MVYHLAIFWESSYAHTLSSRFIPFIGETRYISHQIIAQLCHMLKTIIPYINLAFNKLGFYFMTRESTKVITDQYTRMESFGVK
jgi:phage-related holin